MFITSNSTFLTDLEASKQLIDDQTVFYDLLNLQVLETSFKVMVLRKHPDNDVAPKVLEYIQQKIKERQLTTLIGG